MPPLVILNWRLQPESQPRAGARDLQATSDIMCDIGPDIVFKGYDIGTLDDTTSGDARHDIGYIMTRCRYIAI